MKIATRYGAGLAEAGLSHHIDELRRRGLLMRQEHIQAALKGRVDGLGSVILITEDRLLATDEHPRSSVLRDAATFGRIGIESEGTDDALWSLKTSDAHLHLALSSSDPHRDSRLLQEVLASNAVGSSVADDYPDLAKRWSRRNKHMPSQVSSSSSAAYFWTCARSSSHREIEAPVLFMLQNGDDTCIDCITAESSVAATYPDLVAEWAPENGESVEEAASYPSIPRKWKCATNPDHDLWEASLDERTGQGGHEARDQCPDCWSPKEKWDKKALIRFLHSMGDILDDLAPAEAFAVIQQAGILTGAPPAVRDALIGKGAAELRETLDGVDSGITDGTSDLEVLPDFDAPAADGDDEVATQTEEEELAGDADSENAEKDRSLFEVSPSSALDSMGKAVAHADGEVAEFLERSALAALWKIAFNCDEKIAPPDVVAKSRIALQDTERRREKVHAERIRKTFREQYETADAFDASSLPGWNAAAVTPNLMQKHVALELARHRRLGNWSGTGAGKTISAVLGAHNIGAGSEGVVMVFCPNNVVEEWQREIRLCLPDAQVVAPKPLDVRAVPAFAEGRPRWIVMNYESIRKKQDLLTQIVDVHGVDMVVVDEIHHVKDRGKSSVSDENALLGGENESQQRAAVRDLIAYAQQHTGDGHERRLAVLGMSATPVVNVLQEAVTLLELVEGRKFELPTRATVANAMRVHQHLIRLGVRWMPSYEAQLRYFVPDLDELDGRDGAEHATRDDRLMQPLDVEPLLPDLLAAKSNPLHMEQALSAAKIPELVRLTKEVLGRGETERLVIYTEYVDGLVEPMLDALADVGIAAGRFTGEDKSGLDAFRGYSVESGREVKVEQKFRVLVASSPIAVGINGLQRVCNNLAFLSLPWTHAQFVQVVGRFHRQHQKNAAVNVYVPMAYIATGSGDRSWSYDRSRWNRVQNKKTLADCAVDGVVNVRELRSKKKLMDSHRKWLERIEQEKLQREHRPLLDPLLTMDIDQMNAQQRAVRYGELTLLNGAWGSAHSSVTHKRLTEDPTEWRKYHDLYTAAREHWARVPAEYIAEKLNAYKTPKDVADLGCGERLLEAALTVEHRVTGFDHVAVDDAVTVCDISQVPASDGSFDHVVLCLALMGTNHGEYVAEANRILDLDGYLWLCEPTSHLGGYRERVTEALASYGFEVKTYEDLDKFTYIKAQKVGPVVAEPLRLKMSASEAKKQGYGIRSDADQGGDAGGFEVPERIKRTQDYFGPDAGVMA